MDNGGECEVCHGPGSLGDEDGRVLCVPHRRERRRLNLPPAVVHSVPKRYEHGPRRRPQLDVDRHAALDVAVARLSDTAGLAAMALKLHEAINIEAASPSIPDGYPTSTPGAEDRSGRSVGPLDRVALLELPVVKLYALADRHHVAVAAGWTIGELVDALVDATSRVTLTSVEGAVAARGAHKDEYATALTNALTFIEDAAKALNAAAARLGDLEEFRRTALLSDVAVAPGCWAMARVGSWEPVHATVDVQGEPRPLGYWAYKFQRAHGRLPNLDECRKHQSGRRVYAKV